MAYRILSLDGGGPWALLQVMALQNLYGGKDSDPSGFDVLKQFDLVATTSGGSIVLAELLMNKRLSEILDLFLRQERRLPIFAPANWRPFGAKYSTRRKFKALKFELAEPGERSLAELYERIREYASIAPDLLIAAFDCERKRPEFFRSSGTSRSASAKKPAGRATLLDVVHASTTGPPHFFDTPATIGDGRFWDAATAGLYNPVLAAVAEARANGHEAKNIRVLSIGTGTVQLPVQPRARWPTFAGKLPGSYSHRPGDLLKSFFYDPPDSATYMAHVMLGQPLPSTGAVHPSGNLIRLSPLIRLPEKGLNGLAQGPLSASEAFVTLATLGFNAVEQKGIELVKRFGELWIAGDAQNQAIRASRDYVHEIGHDTFGKASGAWKELEILRE